MTSLHRTSGVWYIRLRQSLFVVKAGRIEPNIAERYGSFVLRIPLGAGWRFIWTKNYPKPQGAVRLKLH